MKIKKIFIFLTFSIGLLISCGQNIDLSKQDYKIVENFLNKGLCLDALNYLNKMKNQNKVSIFYSLKSLSQACLGGYKELDFFMNEIPNLNAAGGALLGSLSQFSSSKMTSPLDLDYLQIQDAINTSLYAGGLSSSSNLARSAIFGKQKADNMDMHTLYLIMVQMGKYFNYYGNVGSTGQKGTGLLFGNTCLATYTDTLLISVGGALDLGQTGSCTKASNIGHVDIETGIPGERTTRLCQGIVLFNNFLDIIGNIDLAGVNTLKNLKANFDGLCATLPIGASCNVYDQTSCEALSSSADPATIEKFFGYMLERQLL